MSEPIHSRDWRWALSESWEWAKFAAGIALVFAVPYFFVMQISGCITRYHHLEARVSAIENSAGAKPDASDER